MNNLLPKLVEDNESLMTNNFGFKGDGASAHPSRLANDCIEKHCPEFVKKDERPLNQPDSNPLDNYFWGTMIESFKYSP